MKKQVCVRTYPCGYTNPVTELCQTLANGYTVVMCNRFVVKEYGDNIVFGNEYILEKECDQNDR